MGCVCARETLHLKGNKFRIIERIAEGGFSRIDLVENCANGQRYAMKRIVCHSTEDQIAATTEAAFHERLGTHPGILSIVCWDVCGNADIVHGRTSEVRIVMPFYERGTLHDELCRRETGRDHFSESEVLNLFLLVCESVLHMHSSEPEPLAHRDIKPHNILLTRDLRPVIMDMGSVTMARVKVTTHSEAQYLQDLAAERCSMPYRPPELFQVSSKCEVDERTDVWSLGCLLYALCFFKSPFDSVFERGDSVALAVQSAESVGFPSDAASAYSPDMRQLITWMLTVNPAMRPHLPQIIDRVKQMLLQRAASSAQLPQRNKHLEAASTKAASRVQVVA